jgi:hypothetical protein
MAMKRKLPSRSFRRPLQWRVPPTAVITVAGAAIAALVAALLVATPAQAATGGSAAKHKPAATPAVKGVHAVKPHFSQPRNGAAMLFRPTSATWPSAMISSVSLAKASGNNDAAKASTPAATSSPASGSALSTAVKGALSAGSKVAVSGTPVWFRTATHSNYEGPQSLSVKVLAHAAATAAGVHGMIFTLNPAATAAVSGTVIVGVDYRSFAEAEGGNFGSRLQLVRLPDCALTTPARPVCQAATPLKSSNDAKSETVSAPLAVPATSPVVLAVSAAATTGDDGGSKGGSYSATSLSPSGSWSTGGSSGSFTYSYPISVPPARTSLTPDVNLSYDSGSVDGKTASQQAQASWAGDGWDTPENYIEQTFVSCSDKPEGTVSATPTADECYDGPILTVDLNGKTTSLIYNSAKDTWVEQGDDGEVVKHVTSTDNGSGTKAHDYWMLTERDGTTFQFGRNELPGYASGKTMTNSVQSEPVYSAHSGDPCWGETNHVCTTAYRWNLDYVTDTHSNAMAYYYTKEKNYYGENGGATRVQYDANAYLDHVDYGFTDGNAYAATGPDEVKFTTGPRCFTTGAGACTLSSSTAKNFPDVPYSNVCAATGTCTSYSPSFFSEVALSSITTKQWSTTKGDLEPVDTYMLRETLPATGDGGAVSPTLWLNGITRQGQDTSAETSGSAITLPEVTFTGNQYQNRTDTTSLPAFYRYRLTSIKTEAGSVITVIYGLTNPCATPVTVTASSNSSSCYPISWTPAGYTNQITDWFNKYVVTQVSQTDPTGGAPALVTNYTYKGGTAWHYDDNEDVLVKYRSYGQFRGYADVQVRTGNTTDKQTLSETTYYRGMADDNGIAEPPLTDSQGGKHDDTDQLAGEPLETTAYLGDGGAIDHSTIASYWVSAPVVSRARTGLSDLTANVVEPAETWTRQAVTTGGTTTWRDTETDTTYQATTSSATRTHRR